MHSRIDLSILLIRSDEGFQYLTLEFLAGELVLPFCLVIEPLPPVAKLTKPILTKKEKNEKNSS